MIIRWIAADLHKVGVYKITIDSKHVYIGYTLRYDGKRWEEHIYRLIRGISNKRFKAIIKNAKTIEFVMLKECNNKAMCEKIEAQYINMYQPDLNVKKNFFVY